MVPHGSAMVPRPMAPPWTPMTMLWRCVGSGMAASWQCRGTPWHSVHLHDISWAFVNCHGLSWQGHRDAMGVPWPSVALPWGFLTPNTLACHEQAPWHYHGIAPWRAMNKCHDGIGMEFPHGVSTMRGCSMALPRWFVVLSRRQWQCHSTVMRLEDMYWPSHGNYI